MGSTKRKTPLKFAEAAALSEDKVGLLFVMTIDPNVTSVPFADIQRESEYAKESEILFSMHAVFRIGNIQRKDQGTPYFEVTLSLTEDKDTELQNVMAQIDGDTRTFDGWERMGHLLIKVGQPNKAEELFRILLENTSNADDFGRYYHGLAMTKGDQGEYTEALSFYEQALEIKKKSLPANHPSLGDSYNNIGLVYSKMGEYSKALTFYEQALEIQKKSLPANHPSLGNSYNNIGLVYYNMGEYSKALSFYEEALEIQKKSLPANHPDVKAVLRSIELSKSKSKKK
jgi:tetratricopeptide (TPR) repeat protein